jgi:hypothetical protein
MAQTMYAHMNKWILKNAFFSQVKPLARAVCSLLSQQELWLSQFHMKICFHSLVSLSVKGKNKSQVLFAGQNSPHK